MRVLTIGSEKGIFNPQSSASARILAYGKGFGFLDLVCFTKSSEKYNTMHVGDGVEAYPTRSLSRLFFISDAISIGKRIPKPNVISVQDPFESGLAGVFLSRALRVPLHVQVHTDLFSKNFSSGMINRLRIVIAPFVLKRASRIRVVSEHIKHDLQKVWKIKAPISVLPIFVNTDSFADAEAPEALKERFKSFGLKFLVVSRLESEKNVALAVHAFAESAPPNSALIILGDGTHREALGKLVKDLNIFDRVFFEGFVDAKGYYKLADLVLSTSRYEGYGMTIVEALASGTSVLSTDVGIAREAGAIIASEDAFVDALKQWLVSGSREGKLLIETYSTKEEYTNAYCEDILKTQNKFV